MKILIADAIDQDLLAPLAAAGHELVFDVDLDAEGLPGKIKGVDVLVVRSTKVSPACIEAADQLTLIVRAGAGTDTIAVDVAAAHGVYVTNVPGRNAVAVAELTMGLLLAIDRHIVNGAIDLRNGVWNKAIYRKADGLHGKHIAIVGLGSIGLEVAERAKAFGLVVSALRRPNRSESVDTRVRSIGIRLVDTLDELLGSADIVSVHVPSNAETVGLVNADFLAKMPVGAILLNTARGDTIDEAALVDALDNRGMWAGLDVWPNEPAGGKGEFVSPLAQHPRVTGSHHIGASTAQAQAAVVDGTIEVLNAFAAGNVINCVNLDSSARGPATIVIRHQDRVGVLAQVFDVLRTHGINVQQMSNQVFLGGEAAVATMNVGSEPDDSVLHKLGSIDEVFGVEYVKRAA